MADSGKEVLLRLFRKYDRKGEGTIEQTKLCYVLHQIDPDFWTKEKLDEAMSLAPKNKQKKIIYEDFLSSIFGEDPGSKPSKTLPQKPRSMEELKRIAAKKLLGTARYGDLRKHLMSLTQAKHERDYRKRGSIAVQAENMLAQRVNCPIDPRILSEPDHSSLPDGSQLLERFREVFQSLQEDGHGGVTPQKLEHALKTFAKSLPKEVSTRINIVVADVFKAIDESCDGVIQWEEFEQWLHNRRVGDISNDDAIATLFELCDADDDGSVSAQELMNVFLLMSQYQCNGGADEPKLTPEVAEAIVRDLDSDGTGGIEIYEFIEIIRAVTAKEDTQSVQDRSLPHLILNFDVSNTVVMFDSATHSDVNNALSMIVSNTAWGKVTYNAAGKPESWKPVGAELSHEAPASGLKTYSEYVQEANPLPDEKKNTQRRGNISNPCQEDFKSIERRRRELAWSFTNCDEPGESFRPKLEEMKKALLLPEGVKGTEKAMQAGLTGDSVNLLPAFLNFLRELKKTGRSFSLIFRTFGQDLDGIEREFNAFCEGRHPYFSDDVVLDGSDGQPDYRMNLRSGKQCGTFFRDPGKDFIALAMGTTQQPSSIEEGIAFFDSQKDVEVVVGLEAVSNRYAELGIQQNTTALRDFYLGWQSTNFKPCGGKPFFLDSINDPSQFSIFFDDHITPASPNVVDPFNPRQYPQRYHSAQLFGLHLVQTQPLHSIMNPQYLIQTLQKCETARVERLARWGLAKRLLGRLVSVHQLLNLFAGAGESKLLQPGGQFAYRLWKESEIVRRCPAVDTFEESDPTEQGPIKFGDEFVRQRFIADKWQPFVSVLDKELAEAQRRSTCEYSATEIMPTQARIHELCLRNLELTLEWHGRPNISTVYEFLMKAAELDGHSPYRFSDLPCKKSIDGFVRAIDGSARKKLHKSSNEDTDSCSVGIMPQTVGESLLDNLVLPNVMTRRRALEVFVGSRVQQFFVNWISKQQRGALKKLGLDQVSMDKETVRAKLLSVKEMSSAGVRPGTLWWECLIKDGIPLASYGQLPEAIRQQGETWLHAVLPKDEPLDEELAMFVEHCNAKPGRNIEHCNAKPGRNISAGPGQKPSVRHKFLLLRAMGSSAVRVAFRTDIERFTQHRYLAIPWTRILPLVRFTEDGAETIVRHPGSKEHSRFRKNIFAYGESHGCGQSAGGYAELSLNDELSGRKAGPYGMSIETTLYELGTAMVQDEAGKIENHWCTDIEKIVREAMILSPEGGESDALPHEVFHDVGQNPTIASSDKCGATQHTQVTRAAAEDFPLMLLSSKPLFVAPLNAHVDIVQIGDQEDAFNVQIRAKYPDTELILQLLIDLRIHMTKKFGSRGVDFNFICSPIRSTGGYVLNLSPVACMQKIEVPAGKGIMGQNFDYLNPDLKTRLTDLPGLPCATVDCSHGKGNVLGVNAKCFDLALEGKSKLVELYDFNRKPGSRNVAASFLKQRYGYEDVPVSRRAPSEMVMKDLQVEIW